MASVPSDIRAFIDKFVASFEAADVSGEISKHFVGSATMYGGKAVSDETQTFAARGAVFNRGHTAKQTVTDIYVSSATNDKYIVTTKAESGDERAAEIQITRSEGGIKIKHYVPFYAAEAPKGY